ncbi:hypothetical protein PYCC9005_003543 [Savitreella phatthalungensis]
MDLRNAKSAWLDAALGDEQDPQTPGVHGTAGNSSASSVSRVPGGNTPVRISDKRHSTATVLLGLLTCPLCGRPLESARTLPCGNSLCDDCWADQGIVGEMRSCPFDCAKGRHWTHIAHDVVLAKIWNVLRQEQQTWAGQIDSVQRGQEFLSLISALLQLKRQKTPAAAFDIKEVLDGLKEVPTLANHTFHLPSDTASIPSTVLPSVLAELECQICYGSLYDPLTTPCGHTFCRTCLLRSVDHTPTCPTCRATVPPPFANLYHAPRSGIVTSLMLNFWPLLWAERKADIEATESSPRALFGISEEERLGPGLTIPIFVCSLAFPYMPTFLHIFEPRYRLMIRRCMQSDRRFGMCLPKMGSPGARASEQQDCPVAQYGTVLRINSVQYLDDGRSLIETTGEDRFKLLRWGIVDGYIMGHCELLPDDGIDGDSEEEQASSLLSASELGFDLSETDLDKTTQELLNEASSFVDTLRNGSAPWMLQRLEMTHGLVPSDPSVFAFWVASVIPVDEEEKYLMLKARSVKIRLAIVLHWLRRLQNHWWFRSQCSIM